MGRQSARKPDRARKRVSGWKAGKLDKRLASEQRHSIGVTSWLRKGGLGGQRACVRGGTETGLGVSPWLLVGGRYCQWTRRESPHPPIVKNVGEVFHYSKALWKGPELALCHQGKITG